MCGPETGWRGAEPQSPLRKTTAPGNLAEAQQYCRPGGAFARAAGPGGPQRQERRRDIPGTESRPTGTPWEAGRVLGWPVRGRGCRRAERARPSSPIVPQAAPLGALRVSRLRPWKEEAEAELLGPRLPGQTSRLPVSVAGCRPGQGQGPRPVLLFLSSGTHIGVTTEGPTQPETCGCESNPGGPGSLAGDVHHQHGQRTRGHLNVSPRTQQLSKPRAMRL